MELRIEELKILMMFFHGSVTFSLQGQGVNEAVNEMKLTYDRVRYSEAVIYGH